ncbi:MAG: response regulator [Patescibacteria group bacterium]
MLPKLLIADDSEAKQLMLEGFVRHNHWNVEILTSASTDEAKKLIDKNPDITFAFVDYEMPTEDGPAVIRYLKAKNSNARIALVSSSDSERYTSAATAAGAERCICTSYQSDTVERAIAELISEWRGN